MKKALLYWAAVMELAGMVIGGALIGKWLDNMCNGNGVFTGILTFLGFAGGVWQMTKIMQKVSRWKDES